MGRHPREIGFTMHEEVDACTLVAALGFDVVGGQGRVTPNRSKYHALLLVFRRLSTRPRVSSLSMEKAISHAIHFATLWRALIGIFRSICDFMHAKGAHGRRRPWTMAAQECR